MRGTNHDKKLREVIFTPSGLAVVGEFSGLEGLLSGSTHKVSASVEEQLHALFMQYLGPMGEKIFTEEKVKGLTAESVKKLMAELSDQGVVSTRRKEEFLTTAGTIFGKSLVSEKVDKRTGGLIHLFNGGNRS
jgi:hypothetical protein